MALPILQDALAALDTIKEQDVGYMRKLGNPPAAIKLVLEARAQPCAFAGNLTSPEVASPRRHSLWKQDVPPSHKLNKAPAILQKEQLAYV